MTSDPFFKLESESTPPWRPLGSPPSRPAGGGGARIRPLCLRIDADGAVRVRLGASAREWFGLLPMLGETLQLTRNPVAVLGWFGRFPAMTDWSQPELPRDDQGLFLPNLGEHASLWAVREITPLGVIHGFEVADPRGVAFHKVVLGLGARREIYEDFVDRRQIPPGEGGGWCSPNHALCARRARAVASRAPWLARRLATGAPDVARMAIQGVARVLDAASEAGLPLRVSMYGGALIHTALWTPVGRGNVEVNAAEGEDARYFQGRGAGLRLSLGGMGGAWLWKGRCACCAGRRWSVEVGDAAGQLRLALAAGRASGESDWQELAESCL